MGQWRCDGAKVLVEHFEQTMEVERFGQVVVRAAFEERWVCQSGHIGPNNPTTGMSHVLGSLRKRCEHQRSCRSCTWRGWGELPSLTWMRWT